MRSIILLAAAVVAGVAFGSVDVSGTINIHADAKALTEFVGVLGIIATLVDCGCLCKRG